MRSIPVTLLLAVLLTACGGGRRGAAGLPPPIGGPGGQPAQTVDFSLQTLDKRTIRLSDFRPRVVLVNYFASWCAPCMDDLPALDALNTELEGLVVVGVNMDLTPETLLPEYLEVVQVHFPVVLADAATMSGFSPFGAVRAIPASFLVDPSGRHVESFQGVAPVHYLRRRVAELIEESR